MVTTNLPFDEWTEVFGSERLTGALLDRAHPPRPHPGDERRELPAQAQPGERFPAGFRRTRRRIAAPPTLPVPTPVTSPLRPIYCRQSSRQWYTITPPQWPIISAPLTQTATIRFTGSGADSAIRSCISEITRNWTSGSFYTAAATSLAYSALRFSPARGHLLLLRAGVAVMSKTVRVGSLATSTPVHPDPLIWSAALNSATLPLTPMMNPVMKPSPRSIISNNRS